MTQNKIIALTGGIGSGKSTALSIIKDLGYSVFSCDDYTEKVYSDDKTVKELSGEFPSAVKKGKVDRKELSKIVFNDEKKYNKLCDIVTKKILSLVLSDAKKEKGLVFIEVPLLFEFDMQDKFDNVFVILRQLDKRISSVMERSKMTREEVEARIKKQFDYGRTDIINKYVVIEHYKEKDSLREKLVKAIENLKSV